MTHSNATRMVYFHQQWSTLPFLLLFLLLASCSEEKNHPYGVSSRYSNYMPSHPEWRPPGPPEDPWGPYISASSERFNVPDQWIRTIMTQESRGYQYFNKKPVTSPHGAKGLMQLKSSTYQDLAKNYDLGKDPYYPRDNIMAGTGYIRILYDRYGAPGFAAAYQGGPGMLDAYLRRERSLPSATQQYLNDVAPKLSNIVPMSGPFASYAGGTNTAQPLPLDEYYHSGPYKPVSMVAKKENPIELAENNTSQSNINRNEQFIASRNKGEPPIIIIPAGFKNSNQSFTQQNKENNYTNRARPIKPIVHSSAISSNQRNWRIQVGAFSSQSLAQEAVSQAQNILHNSVSPTSLIEPIIRNGQTLYRARLTGLQYDTIYQACRQLKRRGLSCIPVQPGS